jgi:hypothetical protein
VIPNASYKILTVNNKIQLTKYISFVCQNKMKLVLLFMSSNVT